jgi:hypothetical protein
VLIAEPRGRAPIRIPITRSASMRLVFSLALTAVIATASMPALAQSQTPSDADNIKPYKQVAFTTAATVTDPAFVAYRSRLGDAAKRKDRAALAKLVSSTTFFWDREGGDAADKSKPGVENLSAAIGLTGTDGSGWELLAGAAQDPTGAVAPDHPGSTCAPADPGFDGKAMQELLESTGSDVAEWGYPVRNGVDVRDKPDPKVAATQKLGLYFVRVAPDASVENATGSFLRIVTPAGKYGYVSIDDVAPLGNDQICYGKEGADWKITGYIGVGADLR